VSALRETLNTYLSQATSSDDKFAHIDARDRQTIVEKCATVQKWLDDQIARQAERPKDVDPVLTSAEIAKKKDEVVYFAVPILTRPKPKPTKTDVPNGTQTPRTDTPGAEGGAQADGTQPEDPPKEDGPPEMDVD